LENSKGPAIWAQVFKLIHRFQLWKVPLFGVATTPFITAGQGPTTSLQWRVPWPPDDIPLLGRTVMTHQDL